ncbi:MAG: FHA domain-containing protein, partial [Planctomycetes bacterium]|nr:FHA domain-containing protein [Planctomycetota bacterium]
MAYLIARGRERDFSARVELPTLGPDVVLRIGRGEDVDVVLPDRSISKVHASLTVGRDGRFHIVDLDSKNGMRLGGRRLTEFAVRPGEEFIIGNLVAVIAGAGPETFRIPETVPRPIPGETPIEVGPSEGAPARSRTGGIVAVIVVLLGVAAWMGWVLPGWIGAKGSTTSTAEEAGDEDAKVVELTPSPIIPRPLERRAIEPPADRAGWGELGRELDRSCATSLCHVSSERVDFRGGASLEWGRWADQLRTAKARGALPTRTTGGWTIPKFSSVAPHDATFTLLLTADATDGVAAWVAGDPPLGPDAAVFEFERLRELDPMEIDRVRRIHRALYGREPTLDELVEGGGSVSDRVTLARTSPEFWRERARKTLIGRWVDREPSWLELALTLNPDEVPADRANWRGMLEIEVDRATTVRSHPYGVAPPLPDEDDRGLEGWVLECVSGTSRPLRGDEFALSVWTVLWGGPPAPAIEAVLRRIGALGSDRRERARIVDALLFAPTLPFPPPTPGREREWLTAIV